MISNKTQDIQLLNDILNRNYYYYFKKDNNNRRLIFQFFPNNLYDNSYIIPTYNTPIISDEEIINNFKILLNWYKENSFNCNIQIDDEFWLNQISFRKQIFDLLFNNLNNINIYITNAFENLTKEDFSFLTNQVIRFKEKNINIIYAIQLENIYNKDILKFAKDNNCNLKIKITPSSIKELPKDFLYLINNYNEDKIFLYEEESQEWTEDKIQLFINFIDFYFNLQMKNKKTKKLLYNIFQNDNFIFSISNKGSIDETGPYGKCKLYHNLNIAVFNLGINFCKKFQYNDLTIGNYEIKNNKITQCIPNNLPAAMIPAHSKRYMLPKCEYCYYLHICNGYCHGDAYKLVMNPLIPIYETCNLKQAKFAYIFYKLKQLNLFNIDKIKDNNSKQYIDHIVYLYDQINNLLGGKNNE